MKKPIHRLLCALGVVAVVAVPIAVVDQMNDGSTNTSAIVQATEAVMTTASPAAAAVMTATAVVQTDIVQSIVNSTETFALNAFTGLAAILGTGFVLLAMQRRRRIGILGNWLAGMKHRVFAIDTGKKRWTDDDDSVMQAWARAKFREAKDIVHGSRATALAGTG